MKKIIILLVLLVGTVAGEAQVKDLIFKINAKTYYSFVNDTGSLIIHYVNPTTIPSCHLDSIIKSLEKRIEGLEKMFIPNTYVDLKHLETNLSRF